MPITTIPCPQSSRKGEREQVPPKNILCRLGLTLGGTQLFKVSQMGVGIFMTFAREGIILN
jgi:hypothetical protein